MKSKEQIKALLNAMDGAFGEEFRIHEGGDSAYWLVQALLWVLSDDRLLGPYNYPEE